MRHTLLYIATLCLLLTACQQEELPNTKTGYGYLSISELSVNTPQIDVVPSRTEAEEEPLTIEIWKGEEKLQTLTEAELDKKIELEAGTGYTLKVYSSEYGKDKEWTNDNLGAPIYYAEKTFEILTDRTTQVQVEVPMINFGVSFSFPEEYKEAFPTCNLQVKAGERTVGNIQPGETAYFSYAEGITFNYTLSVTNTDEEPQTVEGTYGEAENETISAGTVYTVTYEMATRSLSVAQ